MVRPGFGSSIGFVRPLTLALLPVLALGPSPATAAPAPLVSFTSLRIAPAGGTPSIEMAPDGLLRAQGLRNFTMLSQKLAVLIRLVKPQEPADGG